MEVAEDARVSPRNYIQSSLKTRMASWEDLWRKCVGGSVLITSLALINDIFALWDHQSFVLLKS